MYAPRLGHLDLSRRIFGHLENYPKRGYAIKPKPLTIDADNEKVHMKHDFGNQYAYFSKEVDDNFPESLLD